MRARGWAVVLAATAAILIVAAPAGAATFTAPQRTVLYGIACDTWRFYDADVDPVAAGFSLVTADRSPPPTCAC